MHLLSLLPVILLLHTIQAKIPTPACTPHSDHETCLLYWLTNTGTNTHLYNPSSFEAWAHATIYSPDCTPWGATTDGLGTDVRVLAWGLSLTQPLILNSAAVPGLGYDTPVFSYDGQTWAYEDCECAVAQLDLGTHICRCPFKCEDSAVIG
jgi:hypothetical protein